MGEGQLIAASNVPMRYLNVFEKSNIFNRSFVEYGWL